MYLTSEILSHIVILQRNRPNFNMMSPFLRQLFVAGSPQLAALSVGGAVAYPGVLMQQFASNESTIHLDLSTVSWIGSIHGLAGIPSILMPYVMQWRGRKFAFIAACLVSIIGWILAFMASSATTILISESLHGLGNNSLLAVSLLSMSEMVTPKFRNVSMVSFHIVQSFGMALMGVLGRYLHWKTVSLVMSLPITIALIMGCIWPESPSWLAYKGKFDKCERAFIWLRGTDDFSKRELEELITAQRQYLRSKQSRESKFLRHFWETITSKDFYVPCIHMFILLNLTYWSGCLIILIYSIQMIQKATNNEQVAFYGSIIMNSILFICVAISAVLIRRFDNKSVLLSSTFCTTICLISTSVANFLQMIGLIPKESLICLYFLVAYMIATSLGVLPIVFTVAAELMPVKHRGIGGGMYVIFTCVLHATSLKAAPYLFLYANLWGTLSIYAANSIICGLVIWKYVPETKRRTLQEIEDYYKYGRFEVPRPTNVEMFAVSD